jgi:predicted RNA binding protein YcfA (HicA-like mRNA interferase family)
VKRRELIRHLEENGCQELREGARHTVFINPYQKKSSAVPRHNEINEGLVRKICHDLEIPAPHGRN